MKTTSVFCRNIVFVLFLSLIISNHCVHAQGVLLRSVGAVNDSIGSVATATPVDAAGAIYWNPASISGLEKNEISFGIGIIIPKTRVSSSIEGVPMPMSGSTKGNAGSVPDPNMALVWRRCPKSPVTFGLGLGAVGGAASLYPATGSPLDNPILGGRAKSSTVIIMQVTPTVAYKVTDRFSIGVAPIIDLASLSINPMQLGQPLGVDVHNFGTRYAWGGGFQIGTYYDFKNHFKAGFMFKSPIWAEDLTYQGTTASNPGVVVDNKFDLNLPTTLSLGFSYDGIQDTIIGLDIRYFDYAHTAGFKKGVDVEDGVVRGLDWDSVMSIAIGVERKLNQKLKLRMGYCWNESPIPSRSAMLNVTAPLMTQHVLTVGATYSIVKNLELSFAYNHAFKAKTTGPFPTTIPGVYGSVTNEVSANMLLAGVAKKW